MKFVANDPSLKPEVLGALYTSVGWGDQRTLEKTQVTLGRAAYFVAVWEDGELIGFGRMLEDVYWAQILDVMTHPDYRRQGVARGVVSRLVAYAEAQQLSLMLIAARGSEKLYAQFGFTQADSSNDVLMYRPQLS